LIGFDLRGEHKSLMEGERDLRAGEIRPSNAVFSETLAIQLRNAKRPHQGRDLEALRDRFGGERGTDSNLPFRLYSRKRFCRKKAVARLPEGKFGL